MLTINRMGIVMATATLSAVLAVAETDRNTFNYMKRAELLRSKVAETSPGVAAGISRRTALEIAFASALAGAGLKLSDACERANSEFMIRAKDVSGDLLYAINPRTGFGYFFSDAKMSFAKLRNQLADAKHLSGWTEEAPLRAPTAISIIDVAEIVRRVDALYAEAT